MAGRKKTKNRKQQTLYVDRAHLERMQGGVNKSDIVNTALSIYFNSFHNEEGRKPVLSIRVNDEWVPLADTVITDGVLKKITDL